MQLTKFRWGKQIYFKYKKTGAKWCKEQVCDWVSDPIFLVCGFMVVLLTQKSLY